MLSKMLYKKCDSLEDILKSFNNVSKEIKEKNSVMFRFYNKIISLELNILQINFYVLNFKRSDFTENILFICYKNIVTLLSSLKLIEEGYIGSAKILFRNVYESLIIAKYLGTTGDRDFYNKWINGEQISLKKDIFRLLKNKPSKESLEFWDFLNKYNHSTIFSQDFKFDFNKDDIDTCNTIIGTLLEMNYHLFNIYVSKYYNYYLKYYFSSYYEENKNKLKEILKYSKDMLDKRCKLVIKEYSAKWIFE